MVRLVNLFVKYVLSRVVRSAYLDGFLYNFDLRVGSKMKGEHVAEEKIIAVLNEHDAGAKVYSIWRRCAWSVCSGRIGWSASRG